MKNKHFLRGMATVNFWVDDVAAARDWYAELFGVKAYSQQPDAEHPAYVEFQIGHYEDEFGIIDRQYAPKAMQPRPGGAKEYGPITKRGNSGYVTASIIDPFGNILGIMHNPHYVQMLASQTA